jgi:hypothetical protein
MKYKYYQLKTLCVKFVLEHLACICPGKILTPYKSAAGANARGFLFFLINPTNVVMKESLWCPLGGDARGLTLMDLSNPDSPPNLGLRTEIRKL